MKLWVILVFSLLFITAACPALTGSNLPLSSMQEDFLLYVNNPDQEVPGDTKSGTTGTTTTTVTTGTTGTTTTTGTSGTTTTTTTTGTTGTTTTTGTSGTTTTTGTTGTTTTTGTSGTTTTTTTTGTTGTTTTTGTSGTTTTTTTTGTTGTTTTTGTSGTTTTATTTGTTGTTTTTGTSGTTTTTTTTGTTETAVTTVTATSGVQTGDISSQTEIPSSSSSPLISLTTNTAPGHTSSPDVYCGNMRDFEPCKTTGFVCKSGSCYCKEEEPFCRCDNYNNEWFLGEDCSQKWTLVQFALVASLPGLALAVIVGVTIYLVHYFKKPKNHADEEGPEKERQTPTTSFGHSRPGNMYANPVFASDVGNNRRSESPKAARENISMMSRPFSYYSSQPSATSQSYNNPYSKVTRNPYEDTNNSPTRFGDYGRSAQNGITRGFQQASLSSPSYSAPDYDARPQFPRAQLGRHY